jgi:hypothetical protein
MRPYLSFLRGKKFALLCICLYPASQGLNGVDKFIDLFKPTVHRREPQVSDLVYVAQLRHHVSADLRGRNFAAAGLDFMNDVVDRLFENDETYRTFLASLGQTIDELASIEWLVGTIAFDDTEIGALDFFIGGIAISAL